MTNLALLLWADLTDDEKIEATEQYVYIRECEEGRDRDGTNKEYPAPIDPEGVKSCTFYRESVEDGTTTVQVFV